MSSDEKIVFSDTVEASIEKMMEDHPKISREDFVGMCLEKGYIPKHEIKIRLEKAASRSNQAGSKLVTELMYQGYKKKDLLPLIPELANFLENKDKEDKNGT